MILYGKLSQTNGLVRKIFNLNELQWFLVKQIKLIWMPRGKTTWTFNPIVITFQNMARKCLSIWLNRYVLPFAKIGMASVHWSVLDFKFKF